MGINLIFTLVHFLKLQYSIPSKELFLLAKVETQGLDLPSCLKQPKSRQNIRNDGFQDAGLWMMKASAPVRQETDNCPFLIVLFLLFHKSLSIRKCYFSTLLHLQCI